MNAPALSDLHAACDCARNARAVLLDAVAEEGWLAGIRPGFLITLRAGDWEGAENWLSAWMASPGARAASADWVSRRLAMTPQAALEVSEPLRRGFAARLLAACGEQGAARLCAEALHWIGFSRRERAERWAAIAEVLPAGEQPAFLLDARSGLRAALEQGDLLALCGLNVALRAEPEAWERFLASDGWDRCATRWRMARRFGRQSVRPERTPLAIPSEEARRFTRANAPDALPMLERASDLVTQERGAGADSLSSEARSAAEAFLFAILDARALTKGRFALNAPLPFAFGLRTAEADLAAASARLVVELDGYYHFRDAEGYRRDRRKDALLQEHGWFVLRFLAEDILADPGGVITQIERTLARREMRIPTSPHE